MFDVKAKIKEDLRGVNDIKTEIEEGRNAGFLILSFNEKDESMIRYNFGETNLFIWLGILELTKNTILNILTQQEEPE